MATKFEILQGYTDEQQFDSWYALGRNRILVSSDSTQTTRIYTKGNLYYLECYLSELQHCLIYCIEDYIGLLEWETATLVDSDWGYITFGNNIISPNFRFLTEKSRDIEDFYEKYKPSSDFVPFQEEFQRTDVVQITDDDYMRCIACLGAPFIMDEELEYTREQIVDLAIKPAMEEYYKWFPKVEVQTINLTSNVQKVEFPTDAYDIVHFDVQQYGNNANGLVTNTLLRAWTESMYGINNRVGSNGNSIRADYASNMQNYFNTRAYSQAILNYHTRSHIDKIWENGKRYARFYSTKSGTAEIYWAIKTLNFNEIEFARRPEVFKLCNANVKKLFGSIRRQSKSDIPGLVNYGEWINEANTEIKEVLDDWHALVKYAGVMRGGLG